MAKPSCSSCCRMRWCGKNVTQLVVSFSENLLADRSTNIRSVTNPSNWMLYRNSQLITGAVVSVSFGLNQAYIAGLTLRAL